MKVLNLQCELHHLFEGWFGSEEDYTSQFDRGLLACPMCSSTAVSKLPSAPRLNLGAVQPAASTPPPTQDVVSGTAEQALQAAWLQAVQRVVAQTEDVGERFPEEARKIHYGETEERAIRGRASREETEALLDEGIDVLPLPLPDALKGSVQ
jgi:hypothetical protein